MYSQYNYLIIAKAKYLNYLSWLEILCFQRRIILFQGPELLSKYIGASEEAVRNVFQK